MNFNLFQALFARMDQVTMTFATDVSGRAITAATPVITAALTVMFIFYGLLMAQGKVEDSIRDFVFKCFKIGIIVSIGTTGGLYQTQIATAIQQTPNEFAMALLPTQAGQTTGDAAANVVDQAAGEGFGKASEAFQNSGVFTKQGLAYVAFAVLVTISTALLTGIGGAFILLAKVALALLAGVGPLFIFALLFRSTQRFFEVWCTQVLSYGLLVVMVSAVFGYMMQMFTTYMSGITFDGNLNFGATLGGCVILAVVSLFIVIQIPAIAAGLAGGVGVGLWNEMRIAAGIGSAASNAIRGSQNSDGSRSGGMIGAGKAMAGGAGKALGRFRGSGRDAA
jgi:type IV secretion system protein VirB6